MNNSTSSNPFAGHASARSVLWPAMGPGAFDAPASSLASTSGQRPSVAPRRPCPQDYRMRRAELVEAIRGLQAKGEIPDPYPPAAGDRNQAPTFIRREPAQGEPGLIRRLVSGVMSFRFGPEGAMASSAVVSKAGQTCPHESGMLQCFLDDVDTSVFDVISAPRLDQGKAGARLAEIHLLIRLNGAGGAAARAALRLLERHVDPSPSSTRFRLSCLAGMPQLPREWVAEELCDPAIGGQLRVLDTAWQTIASGLDEPARRFGLIRPDESLSGMDASRMQGLARSWHDVDQGHDGSTDESPDACGRFVASVDARAYAHMHARNAILQKLGPALHARLQEPDNAGRARVDIISLDDSNAMALQYLDLYGKDDLVMLLEKESF
jgi:hypothetical protein